MNLIKERKEASSTNALHCQHKNKGSNDFHHLSGRLLDVAKDPPAERKRMQKKSSDYNEEDSETLSDIDDADVDSYIIRNKDETVFKKMIWEKMNKEYVQEQVFKATIAAAEKRVRDSTLSNSCPEDVQAACRAVADLKSIKEKTTRKKQKAIDISRKRPAAAAAAPSQPSVADAKKRVSSKINYDVLDKLFVESDSVDRSKRSRIESSSGYEKNVESDAVGEKDMDEDNPDGGIIYEVCEENEEEEEEDEDEDFYDY